MSKLSPVDLGFLVLEAPHRPVENPARLTQLILEALAELENIAGVKAARASAGRARAGTRAKPPGPAQAKTASRRKSRQQAPATIITQAQPEDRL